jgi:hypothetical protein
VAYPGTFSGGSTNSVDDRGRREWGSGGGTPQSGVPLILQMGEIRILIWLLWMYFPRKWEFGSDLSKLRNFGGGGVNLQSPSVCHCFYFKKTKDRIVNNMNKIKRKLDMFYFKILDCNYISAFVCCVCVMFVLCLCICVSFLSWALIELSN